MASVEVTLASADVTVTSNRIQWEYGGGDRIDLGDTLSSDDDPRYIRVLGLKRPAGSPGSAFHLQLTRAQSGDDQADFNDRMESNGTVTFTASDGSSVVITGFTDTIEPYIFEPSNGAEVRAFANTVAGLTNKAVTVVFNDSPLLFFERVNGAYVQVTPFERVNGSYVEITNIFERVSGSYVE